MCFYSCINYIFRNFSPENMYGTAKSYFSVPLWCSLIFPKIKFTYSEWKHIFQINSNEANIYIVNQLTNRSLQKIAIIKSHNSLHNQINGAHYAGVSFFFFQNWWIFITMIAYFCTKYTTYAGLVWFHNSNMFLYILYIFLNIAT